VRITGPEPKWRSYSSDGATKPRKTFGALPTKTADRLVERANRAKLRAEGLATCIVTGEPHQWKKTADRIMCAQCRMSVTKKVADQKGLRA